MLSGLQNERDSNTLKNTLLDIVCKSLCFNIIIVEDLKPTPILDVQDVHPRNQYVLIVRDSQMLALGICHFYNYCILNLNKTYFGAWEVLLNCQ